MQRLSREATICPDMMMCQALQRADMFFYVVVIRKSCIVREAYIDNIIIHWLLQLKRHSVILRSCSDDDLVPKCIICRGKVPLHCKIFVRLNDCSNWDEVDVTFFQTRKSQSLYSVDMLQPVHVVFRSSISCQVCIRHYNFFSSDLSPVAIN